MIGIMSKILTLCAGFFWFLTTITDAHAVSVTVSDIPEHITQAPFTVSVTVAGASPGTNYLRIDLFEEGSDDYFGETHNGIDFYGGNEGTQYAPITISGSESTATVTARVGNPSVHEYDGEGQFFIRIRRYTGSGSQASSMEAKASAKPIQIDFAYSTPTPSSLTPHEDTPPSPTSVPIATAISNIYISEVLAYPNGDEREWIELYNANPHAVTLTDWIIDDVADGGSALQQFSLSVQANGYAVHELTRDIFNNTSDTVRLLNSDNRIVDSFSYEGAQKNVSFGKTNPTLAYVCSQTPSRGIVNNQCNTPTPITENINTSTTKKASAQTNVLTAKTSVSPQQKQNITKNPQPNTTNQIRPFWKGTSNQKTPSDVSTLSAVLGTSKKAPPYSQMAKTLSGMGVSFSLVNILLILYKIAGKIKIHAEDN